LRGAEGFRLWMLGRLAVARVRVGLTPEDPARVRDDDDQQGLEAFADGGASDE